MKEYRRRQCDPQEFTGSSLCNEGAGSLFRTKAQRIAAFLPQEEFAERIGISQNYLSTMERSKVEIGAEILLRISREFAKSAEWLLTGKG